MCMRAYMEGLRPGAGAADSDPDAPRNGEGDIHSSWSQDPTAKAGGLRLRDRAAIGRLTAARQSHV